mmetsp:Transcript_14198/g.44324  ORF Transcript_14198/g.44324 Transcript_14198/m.44324 type:complete len:470 (-) Transcript_14198:41-1450(-)
MRRRGRPAGEPLPPERGVLRAGPGLVPGRPELLPPAGRARRRLLRGPRGRREPAAPARRGRPHAGVWPGVPAEVRDEPLPKPRRQDAVLPGRRPRQAGRHLRVERTPRDGSRGSCDRGARGRDRMLHEQRDVHRPGLRQPSPAPAFPDGRRRVRLRVLLPPRQPALSAPYWRQAAAPGEGPRRPDRMRACVVQPVNPVLDEPGLCGPRCGLPGQHRLRAGIPRSTEGELGRGGRRGRLRRRGVPGRRGSRRPRAAGDRRWLRRRVHDSWGPGVPRRLHRGLLPLRGGGPRGPCWGHAQVRESLPGRARGAVPRGRGGLRRPRAHQARRAALLPHPAPAGRGGQDRAAQPGGDDVRGPRGAGHPLCTEGLPRGAARLPPERERRGRPELRARLPHPRLRDRGRGRRGASAAADRQPRRLSRTRCAGPAWPGPPAPHSAASPPRQWVGSLGVAPCFQTPHHGRVCALAALA